MGIFEYALISKQYSRYFPSPKISKQSLIFFIGMDYQQDSYEEEVHAAKESVSRLGCIPRDLFDDDLEPLSPKNSIFV